MGKFLLLFLPLFASAQTYFPMREGATLEYRYYDCKGKALKDTWRNERFLRLTVEKMWGDSVANVAVDNEQFERLHKNPVAGKVIDQINYGDVRVTPQGVEMENMQWIFPALGAFFDWRGADESYSDEPEWEGLRFEVTLSAASRLPRVLHVGDSLPDESYESIFDERVSGKAMALREARYAGMEDRISMEMGERMFIERETRLSLSATMHDRYVAGRERVGDFDCWKITYEVVGPRDEILNIPPQFRDTEPPLRIRYVDYISPEVGLVRREKMNGTGRRIEEVMLLTEIK